MASNQYHAPVFALLALFAVSACSGDDPEENTPGMGGDTGMGSATGGESGGVTEAPKIDIPTYSSGLDSSLILADLSDEQIVGACDRIVEVVTEADSEVSCRVVAAGEAESADECGAAVGTCLDSPGDALAATTIRSTPAPIDCSEFNAELAAGCEHPVSLLEDCVNALATSVIPAAAAVSCDTASEWPDVKKAEMEAKANQGIDYVTVCFELLECEDLVSVLLGSGE